MFDFLVLVFSIRRRIKQFVHWWYLYCRKFFLIDFSSGEIHCWWRWGWSDVFDIVSDQERYTNKYCFAQCRLYPNCCCFASNLFAFIRCCTSSSWEFLVIIEWWRWWNVPFETRQEENWRYSLNHRRGWLNRLNFCQYLNDCCDSRRWKLFKRIVYRSTRSKINHQHGFFHHYLIIQRRLSWNNSIELVYTKSNVFIIVLKNYRHQFMNIHNG